MNNAVKSISDFLALDNKEVCVQADLEEHGRKLQSVFFTVGTLHVTRRRNLTSALRRRGLNEIAMMRVDGLDRDISVSRHCLDPKSGWISVGNGNVRIFRSRADLERQVLAEDKQLAKELKLMARHISEEILIS